MFLKNKKIRFFVENKIFDFGIFVASFLARNHKYTTFRKQIEKHGVIISFDSFKVYITVHKIRYTNAFMPYSYTIFTPKFNTNIYTVFTPQSTPTSYTSFFYSVNLFFIYFRITLIYCLLFFTKVPVVFYFEQNISITLF